MSAPAQPNLSHPRSGWELGVLIGVAAGALSLAAWLSHGERLPLQNLWRSNTAPDAFPWALLPLSQYFFASVFALLAMGGLFAGLAVRWTHQQHNLRWVQLGLFAVQVLAAQQSLAVLVPGLAPHPLTAAYVAATVVVCLAGVGLGQLILKLVTSAQRESVAIGVSLAAALITVWAREWTPLATSIPEPIWTPISWLPAVVVGAALAWCGLRTKRAALAWAISLASFALLWAGLVSMEGAVAVNTIRGGAFSIAAAYISTFLSQLDPTAHIPQAVGVAAVLGLIGAGAAAFTRPRQPRSTQAGSRATQQLAEVDDVTELR